MNNYHMSYRDQEFIDNRLTDAGPATEAVGRLSRIGRADLAQEVTYAARQYLDRLRRVRNQLYDRPVDEFSGITTDADDPRHAQEVVDHIAHLDEEQVEYIRQALNQWKKAAREREEGDIDPIGDDIGQAQDALSWEKGGPTS